MSDSVSSLYGGDSRGFFGALLDKVLGADPEPVPSPVRLRDECLVSFLFFALPVLAVSSIMDVFLGYTPISWALLAVAFLIAVLFMLLRAGLRHLGIDLFFFGCTLVLSIGYLVGAANSEPEEFVLPLLYVILFAAIVFYGMYARSARRVAVLFLIAAAFDMTECMFGFGRGASFIVNRLGVVVLHFAAYGLASFLRAYYDKLTRVSEARRMMNRRLEELVAEARVAGSERLASFSHDIRSPITGIIGVHDLLSSTKLDEEQRSYLAILAKSNRLLLEMVESMLDDEHSSVKRLSGSSSVRAFLDDSLSPYRELARLRGIALRRQVLGNPAGLPLPRADAARVIGNLVDNALKYTDAGRIAVTVQEAAESVDLIVEDTGRGMSPDRLAAVRAGIAGADETVSSSRGIGLSGVRRTTAALGAELRIESEQGKGTRITIRFPLPEGVPSDILADTIP